MPTSSFIPSNIGSIALRSLAQAQEAQVWGVTSRGLFLHLPSGWIVFLSAEPFRGPLTLNFPEIPPALQAAAPGTAVEIQAGGIYFKELDVTIQLNSVVIWSAPPLPDARAERLTQRLQRLEQVVQRLQNAAISVQLKAKSYQLSAISHQLTQNLGLGTGLTPAGDDVALGFLLAANRWRELLFPDVDLQSTNHAIQQAACAKTSTLSANLIDCAIQGQADERLILALDGIITRQPGPEKCISYLSGWGSSSGAWALQGMALAIKSNTGSFRSCTAK